MGANVEQGQEFIADGCYVYGFTGDTGHRVLIATAESPSWAEQIADVLTQNPDAYVV
ncbi:MULTISPECIES: hypothetical protein [Mycobacterium avium complex (MAC)]|jgi:hypothetical protein|uniref:hypothetical protein n=1 Tax=Mycobacterium avium complex (MAC) TaxID=120793 RepID=UPI001483CDB9|nr:MULTISPECIES: hypothetical protein [Mycobacterium avium complex (MAC)]UCN12583.1 hypothetical protein LFT50_29250 [Mycobacterium intracellulare subsp. chimaera]